MNVVIQDMQRDQYALCKFNLLIQLAQGYDLVIQGCRLINGKNGQFVGMPQIQWTAQNGEKRKMNTVKLSDQMNSYIRGIVVQEYERLANSNRPMGFNNAPAPVQGFPAQNQGFGQQQQQAPMQQPVGIQFGNQGPQGPQGLPF